MIYKLRLPLDLKLLRQPQHEQYTRTRILELRDYETRNTHTLVICVTMNTYIYTPKVESCVCKNITIECELAWWRNSWYHLNQRGIRPNSGHFAFPWCKLQSCVYCVAVVVQLALDNMLILYCRINFGCVGKERRTIFGPWMIPKKAVPESDTGTTLKTTGPVPGKSR